jgi:HD-GYP domain-containing protein (c-di-GMP phosphodiesterase class II)
MNDSPSTYKDTLKALEPSEEALVALDELAASVDKSIDRAILTRMRHAIAHLVEHSDRAHIVAKCAMELVEAASPMDVLEATLAEAIRLTRAERGHILMWNEARKVLEPAGVELKSNAPTGEELEICNTIARMAFDQGKVLVNPDVQSDPDLCNAESVKAFRIRSVLVAPLIAETNKGQQRLGVVYLDSRAAKHLFVEDDARLMQSFAALAAISIAHLRAVRQLRTAYHETVNALVRALEAKDKYTRGHSERVAEYAVRCGREMGLSEDRLTMLKSAALLHDVGKIGIREAVLFKPGRLTDDEYEHIKHHAELSEDIVRGLSYLEEELAILGASQEHYDGSGYPRATKGEEIPIESYIIQAADAWDAMTSTRVYRVAMTPEQASAELRRFSGSQFHPEVVAAFLNMIEKEGLIAS